MSNRRYRGVKMSKSPKSSICQNLCQRQQHIFASAQVANEYLSSGYRQQARRSLTLKIDQMPQKHYAATEISHPTTATAPEPNAIALPDNWAQPDFKFGDTVKTNDESYIVMGLVMDTDLDIWKYLCRSRDNTERFFWEYQLRLA